jgi:hypothetical protein
LKRDPTRLGDEWQRQRRLATARFMGERVDAAFGEAFRCVDPLKLDYLYT